MPFSKSFILIPVCITVSKAFWKSTKQANTLPSLLLQFDGKITEAEPNSAIKEMKSNKSTGLDNISNEMLKSGQSLILIMKHFNLM
jgi:hypothetical protein